MSPPGSIGSACLPLGSLTRLVSRLSVSITEDRDASPLVVGIFGRSDPVPRLAVAGPLGRGVALLFITSGHEPQRWPRVLGLLP